MYIEQHIKCEKKQPPLSWSLNNDNVEVMKWYALMLSWHATVEDDLMHKKYDKKKT